MRKQLATVVLALTGAFAIAQLMVSFHDKDGNLDASGPGGGSWNYKIGGNMKWLLKGLGSTKASITSKSQGLSVSAASINAEFTPAKGTARSRIQSALATGGVNVMKDVVLNGARQVTEMHSATANYAAGSTEGRLTLSGGVTIRNVDAAKRQTSVVTGSEGVVLIDPDATGSNAVRTATLSGTVKVTVLQEPQNAGEPPSNFVATGDRLVYGNTTKPSTITLSGNVNIVGTGDRNFDTQGVDQAVITLNEKGEMTEISGSGSPATTRIRKAGGKG